MFETITRRRFLPRIALTLGAALFAFREAYAAVLNPRAYVKHEPPPRYRDRLKWNIRERIWLRMWEQENNPHWSYNGGVGILEHCLDREPTEAERVAVAGVIQWFGTNCGFGFLRETLETEGYRLENDDRLPNSDVIRKYDYYRGPLPQSITIQRRGQSFKV